MACNAGPDIIEDGLVLCLDAANINSYPKSGTTWSDLAGANDGALINMDFADNYSDDNRGLFTFDGADERIRIPNSSSLQFGTGGFTAFAWIYPSNVNNVRIINNRGTGVGGSYKGYQLKITNVGSNWGFSDAGIDDASGNYKALSSVKSYPRSRWYYVNMIYEQDNRLVFYVNGVVDSVVTVGTYGDISNSLPTAIGCSICTNGVETGPSQFYSGKMSQVGLYNRALTADEVRRNYEATVGRFT